MALPKAPLLIALVLVPVLAALVGLQVRWLGQLEDARSEQVRRTLERGVVRIADELDEAGVRPEDVSPDAVEAAIERALGADALATYRVEIVGDDGSALYRSHGDEPGDDDPPVASAPVFVEGGNWVGFFGNEDGAEGGGWQQVEVPLTAAPARWHVVASHRGGSLEAVMARGRVQNLVVGGLLLSVLVGGVALLFLGERRARKLAEKELLFVAGVSHELRTPLTVIRTAASNLEEGIANDPGKAREYGALIGREIERVGARVERVLRFANDAEPAKRENVDVAQLVEEAFEGCRHWRDRRTFELERNVEPNLEVHGDRAALTSALENLIDNAIKYGPDGQTVRVSAARRDRGVLALEVADEGSGVAAGERARIFEPFYRGSAAREGTQSGSGLGLAVVAQVAADHGGEVRLVDSPRGATFSLRLPARNGA